MRFGKIGLICVLASACAHPSPSGTPATFGQCELAPPGAAAPIDTSNDLDRLKIQRNYFAIDQVGPFARHFTIFFHNIDASSCHVTVQTQAGTESVLFDRCGWGGLSVVPKALPVLPDAVVADVTAITREFKTHCPSRDGRSFDLRYDGTYREVQISEYVPWSPAGQRTRLGRTATMLLAADEGLTQEVRKPVAVWGGFGLMRTTKPQARWFDVALSPELEGRGLVAFRVAGTVTDPESLGPTLVSAALQAARVSSDAADLLAPILASQGERLLPEARPQSLRLHVAIGNEHLSLALPLEAAVRGEARADGTVGAVTVRATLAAESIPTTSGKARFALSIHLQDSNGRAMDKKLAASGELLRDSDQLFAPSGIALDAAPIHGAGREPLTFVWPQRGSDIALDLGIDPRDLESSR